RVGKIRLHRQPVRVVTFNPVQQPGSQRPQGRHIVGNQGQAERQHPESQYRKEAENATADQEAPQRHSNPDGGGPPQPPHGRAKTLWQSVDQPLEAVIDSAARF
ncbi:MAG: hypothetical protein KGL96_10155, partial [Hyphomicrobiales bacterium]|nr:hypothetical protein [Hyphomicrobiales bacterium]